LLSAFAQIVLKMGMSNPMVLSAIQSQSQLRIFQSIVTNIYVIGGLTLYFASAAVWLFVLAKVDVSYAYPFVGLGFVVTMLLAFFISGEPLTATKIAGTLLIALGVAVISQG
jgi:multidrug transporter EmrE-like cation transporter